MAEQTGSRATEVDFSGSFAVLPLRDVVVYPHMVIPLFVGRDKSIAALDHATQKNQQILLVAQQRADVDDPDAGDMYETGALANILQLLKLPDGTVKVLVEGSQRVQIQEFLASDESQKWYAEVNNEYPVREGVEISNTLKAWGNFKSDVLNLAVLGDNNAEAVRIMDRANWR